MNYIVNWYKNNSVFVWTLLIALCVIVFGAVYSSTLGEIAGQFMSWVSYYFGWLGLAVIATPLVELLLGEKWLPCVPYLQIMCFVWWLQPTQTCSAQAIKAIGRSDLYLYIELIIKAIGLALLGIAVFIFDTVFAIAVMYLIGQLSAVLIYGYYSHKYIGYKIHYQLADLVIPAFLAAIMGIIVVLMSHLSGNGIWGIVIQITSGTIAYVLLAHLLKVESFSYICNLLKSHNRKI